ncbi:AbrB/MazE/SpoVT family DNA-binding domain-containing protein [Candidatus Bathyarchaeota archaeon]|nr:MAG: AbrB/MazE/SpoVT family DNA-binding domain-containing protein [Candidatus Bathyarchaeota archaeon]
MSDLELRKLQMTGGASYTVSLPKDWIKAQGLKMGDVVAVMPRPDSSLTIIPHQKVALGQEKGSEVVLTPSKDQDKERILRTFIAQYLAGYEVIRIVFPAAAKPDLRTYVKEQARRMFVGAEIIEESKDELIVQCLSSYGDLPAPKVISRMSLIAKLMLRDAVEAFRSRDKALAEEVVHRDEEVDRFYLFLIRQLTLAVLSRSVIQEIGLSDPRDCLVYRLVSKSLERIADHAATMARLSKDVEDAPPQRLLEGLTTVSTLASGVLEDALKAMTKVDAVSANNSILTAQRVERDADVLTDKLYEMHLNPKTVVAIRLTLESLKRIAEYSEDIAEMAINLTARRKGLY